MAEMTKEPKVPSETLDKHLEYIRALIIDEAVHLAQNGRESVPESTTFPREQDIWQAALKFVPGIPFPQQRERSRLISFGGWTNTGVLAVLTFVFGLLRTCRCRFDWVSTCEL
jgi:hypothetical protein